MSKNNQRIYRRFYTKAASGVRKVGSRLQHWMEHHPVVSNSVLCLNLWVAGDALAQYSEHRNKNSARRKGGEDNNDVMEYDYKRTAKCAGFGAMFTGPLIATWYPFLDRVCTQYNIAARYGVWGPPVAKVLADELLMDPPCIFTFFGYMSAWEVGQSTEHSLANWPEVFQAKLQHQFFPSWCASLVAWPPILLGTFRFLPVYAQAPVINVCCIVWDAFLSHRNSLSEHEKDNEEVAEESSTKTTSSFNDIEQEETKEEAL